MYVGGQGVENSGKIADVNLTRAKDLRPLALLAGGGIRGGQAYGSSDRRAEHPADKPVTPAHIAKTVYHAMGIHDLEAADKDGRTFNLLAEGDPLPLF